jgi:hypothetical protein
MMEGWNVDKTVTSFGLFEKGLQGHPLKGTCQEKKVFLR